MSSSASRGGERMIHQDFIARIRYSNALPPPPNPPKLLDIPNTGLASGQYTTPGFASRLAREQPLNIEADAELGMPLDLVGMPGIFDGDESSIQAPSHPPPIHPHDRALLRPLSTLGRPKGTESSVSFLRRTEYISSNTSKKYGGSPASSAFLKTNQKRPEKRPASEAHRDSPAAIKRKIDRSFEIAEQYAKDPKKIQHPGKRNVKLLESFPLIPDLDAFPDSGAYVTVKLLTNPVASSSTYDRRLLSGLLRPIQKSPAEEESFQAALEAHERDPLRNPKPANMMNYSFYLAQSANTADSFREKFDVENPARDEDSLYTQKNSSGGCFQFSRLRGYETTRETEMDHETKYDDEIILSFNDDTTGINEKAVYYYPVMQRSTIRPQRAKNIARTMSQMDDVEEQVVDQLDITIEDPTDDMRAHMLKFKEKPYGFIEDEEEDAAPAGKNGSQRVEHNGSEANGSQTPSDRDAEGDEDD